MKFSPAGFRSLLSGWFGLLILQALALLFLVGKDSNLEEAGEEKNLRGPCINYL